MLLVQVLLDLLLFDSLFAQEHDEGVLEGINLLLGKQMEEGDTLLRCILFVVFLHGHESTSYPHYAV